MGIDANAADEDAVVAMDLEDPEDLLGPDEGGLVPTPASYHHHTHCCGFLAGEAVQKGLPADLGPT